MSSESTPTNADQPEGAGKPAAKPPAKPVPPKPPAAAKQAGAKPAAAGKKGAKGGDGGDRRAFFAWTAFAATGAAMTLGLLRFLFPNVLAEPPSQFRVGSPDQFEPGTVDTRWTNTFQVWIVNLREEGKLIALSTVCTHLGCTPSWLEQDKKFKCPCHGSGFYQNGINFEGPAPRPLERFAISEVDGVVVVDKSKKFQFELGQWGDPESFLKT